MAQEGLAARSSGKAGRYSSYAGGCSPAPENLLRRDFHAREPGQRWLADITKTKAADGRICLSPVLDCFDGRIVAYSAGRRADAELANSSLSRAIATLGADARPIVHSDRGGHCRWPEWISICFGSIVFCGFGQVVFSGLGVGHADHSRAVPW